MGGAGSSGKSTLFKQLKQIYHDGLDATIFQECRFLIRSNCVMSIVTLLKRSQYLYDMDSVKHKDCWIDLDDNKEIVAHIQNVLDNQTVDELTPQSADILKESINFLWHQDQVKATFAKRQYFSFIENMDYFFSKIDDIFDMKYEPTLEDTLKCRARTTGLIEEKFMIKQTPFSIFDAGGQRTERRKWIQLFEGVTAIIFVAALNHFCTVLFEDERKNGMQESLELFDEIVNAKWFRKTAIILFLNKNDIFEQRLREGLTLDLAFPDEWTGPNYKDEPEQKEADDVWFKKCSQQAADFIGKKYRKLNKKFPNKKIFIHVTTATDQDNIKRVFWDVQNIVISKNLTGAGLV